MADWERLRGWMLDVFDMKHKTTIYQTCFGIQRERVPERSLPSGEIDRNQY